jgi:dienelactone hydrolase
LPTPKRIRSAVATGEQPSVVDFFQHPKRWTYSISPDGNWISFLKPWGAGRRLNIFVEPIGDGQPQRRVTSETERDIRTYFWKGNHYLIYQLDPVRDQNFHLYCVDLRNPNADAIDLTIKAVPGPTEVVARLEDSDEEMLVQTNIPPRPFDVYRLNLGTYAMTKLAEAPNKVVRKWLVDKKGTVRGMSIIDGLDIILRTRPDGISQFRTIFGTDFRRFLDDLHIVGEDQVVRPAAVANNALVSKESVASKEMIYAISNIGRDTRALVRIDPQTGELKKPAVYAHKKFDVSEMEVSRNRGVSCAKFMSWRNERKCLDPATQELYDAIGRKLNLTSKKVEVEIVARDQAEEKFVVVVSSDQNPGECYLFERNPNKTWKVSELAKRSPDLKKHLSPTKPIEYPGRDRLKIPGYLTVPLRHAAGRRLPLIVIPHGGPWTRNTWGFSQRENQEAQFFASRGYAVLQMNFRGSVGYGLKFWEAGFKQWGQAMQDDIDAGVLWAINVRKIADPERIAIVGESYGGYAALVAIAFPREREFKYAAAVDRAGISDLLTRMLAYNSPDQREMVGDPVADRAMLIAVSPALHAHQIETPLLVAHGKHDGVVDPSHSNNIVAALYGRGAEVEYLPLEEGHIFLNEESKIEYYEKVERFLKKHLR